MQDFSLQGLGSPRVKRLSALPLNSQKLRYDLLIIFVNKVHSVWIYKKRCKIPISAVSNFQQDTVQRSLGISQQVKTLVDCVLLTYPQGPLDLSLLISQPDTVHQDHVLLTYPQGPKDLSLLISQQDTVHQGLYLG